MGYLFICETATLPPVARSHRHFIPQGHILWSPSTLKVQSSRQLRANKLVEKPAS